MRRVSVSRDGTAHRFVMDPQTDNDEVRNIIWGLRGLKAADRPRYAYDETLVILVDLPQQADCNPLVYHKTLKACILLIMAPIGALTRFEAGPELPAEVFRWANRWSPDRDNICRVRREDPDRVREAYKQESRTIPSMV